MDCKRCVEKRRRQLEAESKQIADSYGKVTESEYRKAVAFHEHDIDRFAAYRDNDCFNTFREEIDYYHEDDAVVVIYTGGCRTCGLRIYFKHVEPYPETQ